MSAVEIVLIVILVVLVAAFVGGLAAARRRAVAGAGRYERHVAEADQALEQARAADKGWDRTVLDATARRALERDRPDFAYDDLHLVLVDDRPGVAEDRAHFAAVGRDGEARVVLVRDERGWAPERID